MAKRKDTPNVKVIKDDPKTQPTEVIASALIEISRGVKALMNGRLKREAVIALVHDRSKINKGVIAIVLNNLDQLESYWCKTK